MSRPPLILRACLAVASLALPLLTVGVVVQLHADVTGQGDATSAEGTPSPGASSNSPSRTPDVGPNTEPSATPDLSSGDKLGTTIRTIRAVATRPHVAGYERGCSQGEGCVFGPAWSDDVNVEDGHNGCDTRNDVLGRDLHDITYKPGTRDCVVLEGSYVEPYTGRPVDFVRGANNIQIDHLIPLALAWDLGAARWTSDVRKDFANDPRNLLAVDGSANASKSDQGPGSWMPINKAYRCTYVQKIADVALDYDLALPRVDLDSMLFTASTC